MFQEKILSKGASSLDKPLSSFLQDPDLGPDDKVRLFIIYLLSRQQQQTGDEQQNHGGPQGGGGGSSGRLSTSEVDSYCAELEASGCDIRPVHYIRKWMSITSMGGSSSAKSRQSLVYTGEGTVGTAKMFSNLLSQGSQFVMEGVKNFVITQRVRDYLICTNKSKIL